MSSIQRLAETGSMICCDSADIAAIKKYKPHSVTTNFSFILAAIKKPEHQKLLDIAIEYGKSKGEILSEQIDAALDRLHVEFGREILQIVPGTVSTAIEAKYAVDTIGNVTKASQLLDLYKSLGVDTNRVMIKVASTWEGIQACRVLSQKGIKVNMTLMFSLPQAIAAAEAGAFVISPFVGRVLDWHIKTSGNTYTKTDDPGVRNLKKILDCYNSAKVKTSIIAASFRNVDQITELAGLEYLTISPQLLEDLSNSQEDVPKKVMVIHQNGDRRAQDLSYIDNEVEFRSAFNEDKMAVEVMNDSIQKFAEDAASLRAVLHNRLSLV